MSDPNYPEKHPAGSCNEGPCKNCEEMETLRNDFHDQIETMSDDLLESEHCVDELTSQVDRLQKKLKRMEAVVEAAREFVTFNPINIVRMVRLTKALADLEKEDE